MSPAMRIGGALIWLIVWICPSLRAQPFTNGSFETPSITAQSYAALNPGDTWLTGWSVGGTPGSIDLNNGTGDGMTAYDGSQFIVFNGGNAPSGGSLSQTFRSVIGTTYIMTLELAQLGSGPSGNNSEQLGAGALAEDGSILAANSFVPPTDVWASFHLEFVATTTNTTIVLTDISPNTDDVDLGLDDVVVATNSTRPTVVTNGSFEMPPLPAQTYSPLSPGDIWLTGWSVGGTPGSIDLENGTADGMTAYDGNQFIVFNGGDAPPGGSLSQTFSSVVGTTYIMTLELAQLGSGPSGNNAEQLSAGAQAEDGSILATNSFVPPTDVWASFFLGFVATTTNTTIVLTDTSPNTDQVDLGLDDVALETNNARPAVIVTSPNSQSAEAGSDVTFTVAIGGGAASVQWFFATPAATNTIDGATNLSVTVVAGDQTAGRYFAQASNILGAVNSDPALLTVFGIPFTNGGFEETAIDISSNWFEYVNLGDTWLTGWLVGGLPGTVRVINGTADAESSVQGNQWVAFNAGATSSGGGLEQTFSTAIGQGYSVTMDLLLGIYSVGGANLTARAVASDGTSLVSRSFSPPWGTWEQFELGFVATTTNTTLVLWDTSPQSGGALLGVDNVVVETNNTPPAIVVSGPVSQTAEAGTAATFSVNFQGGQVGVQWYQANLFETNAIEGATNADLTLVAGYDTAARYFAVVSNVINVITTEQATLTVLDLPFTNGGFDEVLGTNGLPGTLFSPEETNLPGWVGEPLVNLFVNFTAPGWSTYDGGESLHLGGPAFQTFSTDIGSNYLVTFVQSQPAGEDNSAGVLASVYSSDGVLLTNEAYSNLNYGWTPIQFVFTAVSENSTLEFANDQTVADGVVDAVSVVPFRTNGPPEIVLSPQSQYVIAGAPTEFVARANGGLAAITWLHGSNVLIGDTSSNLVITASDATAGAYSIMFSNTDGVVRSTAATLTVLDPPVIKSSPTNAAATLGSEVTFTASVSGDVAGVQWWFRSVAGSEPIDNATNDTLTLNVESLGQAGDYWAVFSNSAGSVASAVARLTVSGQQPFTNGSFEVTVGESIPTNSYVLLHAADTWLPRWSVFSSANHFAVVRGSYNWISATNGDQWFAFLPSFPPDGALAQTFSTMVGTPYRVGFSLYELANSYQPVIAEVAGNNGAILVSNSFLPRPLLWVPYQLDFVAQTTNVTLMFDAPISEFSTTVGLDNVTVTANPTNGSPIILVSPQSQTNVAGTTATFSSMAAGGPSKIHWYHGGAAIAHATNLTLSVTASATTEGIYSALFTNVSGSVTSAPATLTVLSPPARFSASLQAGRQVTFQLTGTPGYPYALMSTTNLTPPVIWEPVVTNVASTNGDWSFTDTNVNSEAGRFYRALLQQ